jgi:hypothetical protein
LNGWSKRGRSKRGWMRGVLSRLIYVRWRVVGPRTLLMLKLKRSKITVLRVARDKILRQIRDLVVCRRPKTRCRNLWTRISRDVDWVWPPVLAEE